MKSILVIGLGYFGAHMAHKLAQQGGEVMGVDESEKRVDECMSFLTNGQIGDARSEHFIASLGVKNFDLCVVAIGDDFQTSLEATALLKDAGAKWVLARANNETHGKFLLRNGADEVVYPELDTAERLAVKYGSEGVFDYIELTPDYAIYEIATPENWVGKTLGQLAIRTKYGVSILAIKQRGAIRPLPGPEHAFASDETLIVLGEKGDMKRLV